MFNKFRGSISQEDLRVFEKGATNGSLYWLEKRLLEELIRGNDQDVRSIDRVDSILTASLSLMSQTPVGAGATQPAGSAGAATPSKFSVSAVVVSVVPNCSV